MTASNKTTRATAARRSGSQKRRRTRAVKVALDEAEFAAAKQGMLTTSPFTTPSNGILLAPIPPVA